MRILFVCHGNICRSPMAGYIMKNLVKQVGLDWSISSAATTTEALGNDIYPNAKAELNRHGIPFERRRARQFRSDEYKDWDLIIAMDMENLNDIRSVIGSDPEKKVKLLMSFAGEDIAVSDPWYTRDFARAYNDIHRGCEGLLRKLVKKDAE